jgi:pimeloyl-ACP methyl ester carboxylesterase
MLQYALLVETNAKLMRREDLLPYFKHLAQMDPLIFLRTLKSLDAHSARDHLPHVSVPTLVAGGEKDTFTPAWLSRRMAHAIPHSELLIVPGGSHTAPLEQPQLIGDAIERFLTERLSLTADLPNPRG